MEELGMCEACHKRPAVMPVNIGFDRPDGTEQVITTLKCCQKCIDDARIWIMLNGPAAEEKEER